MYNVEQYIYQNVYITDITKLSLIYFYERK